MFLVEENVQTKLMNSIQLIAVATTVWSCASSSIPGQDEITIEVVTATYTPTADVGYAKVTLELHVHNHSGHAARVAGCLFNIDRESGATIVSVSMSTCSDPQTGSTTVSKGDTASLALNRIVESRLLDDTANYQLTTAVAFGPDFRLGIPFKSDPFSLQRSAL